MHEATIGLEPKLIDAATKANGEQLTAVRQSITNLGGDVDKKLDIIIAK